jgi:hypothetical protein
MFSLKDLLTTWASREVIVAERMAVTSVLRP